MRLLDLFCGAGGAAVGYHRAGFDEIVGVDNRPMPRYPFTFVLGDALEYVQEHGHEFEAIHASPPCQHATMAGQQWRKVGRTYPDLIPSTRAALLSTGLPYVIENVRGTHLLNPVALTGLLFGRRVRRTRYFESNIPLAFVLLPPEPRSNFRTGRPVKDGDLIMPVGHFGGVEYARREMECPWMTGKELSQAIPPTYTEFIGRQLLQFILNGRKP